MAYFYSEVKHWLYRSLAKAFMFICQSALKVQGIGSLVVIFGVLWPFETIFQSILGCLPESGRKKTEMMDESRYKA